LRVPRAGPLFGDSCRHRVTVGRCRDRLDHPFGLRRRRRGTGV